MPDTSDIATLSGLGSTEANTTVDTIKSTLEVTLKDAVKTPALSMFDDDFDLGASILSSKATPEQLAPTKLQDTIEDTTKKDASSLTVFDDDFDLGTSILSNASASGSRPTRSKLQDSALSKTARLSHGRTLHLKKKLPKIADPLLQNKGPQPGVTETVGNRNYFGVPIHKLLDKVEEEIQHEQQLKAVAKQPQLQKSANRPTALLSEKWRPKKWIDLIGPEKTHRQLLKWLLGWSSAVFKAETTASASNSNEGYSDPFDRPQRRIMLIHGPPGIGKTTVAHVIAKHAGYDVLEINASDERSGQLVKDKIKSAVATHRVAGNPVCVIADEVEGASESVSN